MIWSGIRPYERFIDKLQKSNPTLLWQTKSEPQEYRVAQATVPYTNTPEHASSMFIRNIRYMPYNKLSFVRIGNSTYLYPMDDHQLAAWLKSRSLGRYYNQYLKIK